MCIQVKVWYFWHWVIINIIGEPLETYGTGKNAGACWSAYFGVLIYI